MPAFTSTGAAPTAGPDGGDSEFGCLLASGSILVGDAIGLAAGIVSGEPIPLLELGILGAAVGYGVGVLGLSILAGGLAAMVPAMRARLDALMVPTMTIIPGIVALGTWLVALWIDIRDGGMVLAISFAIVVVSFLLPLLDIVLRVARPGGRPRQE